MTANATWIRAGEVKNTIPPYAEACIDLRASYDDDLLWAIGEIGRFGSHLDVRLRCTDEPGFPAMTRSEALVDVVLDALARHGAIATEEVAGGVSDASWASRVGVPSVDGLGPVGGLDHTDDEWIALDSAAPRIAATVDICAKLGAAPAMT